MSQKNVDFEIWTRFIEAAYLIDAKSYEGKCPQCSSSKDCNNYYCLHCKVGGLCPITFRGNGAHTQHPCLQVRRQSLRPAVDPEELARFLPHESVKHIQTSSLNDRGLCYLRNGQQGQQQQQQQQAAASSRRPPANRARRSGSSSLKSCEACRKTIANSQGCEEDFLLCSVECLITLARRQPARNLLRMRAGALAQTNHFPPTVLEKIKGNATTSAPTRPSPKSRSKAPVNVGIEDREGRGSSSGADAGGDVGGEEETHTAAGRGSSGRRSVPVNYKALHHGGVAAAGSSRTAPAPRARASSRDSSGGRSSRRAPASRTASQLANWYEGAGIHNLVTAVKDNGDWDQYLGNLGRN